MYKPLLAALALVTCLPVSAFAHDKTLNQRVAGGSGFCLYEQSLLREDVAGNGFGRGTVRSYQDNCASAVTRDASYLAQALYVYYRKNASDPARLCVYTVHQYNPSPTWAFHLSLPFPDKAYCGGGYYEVRAAGYQWVNGAWRGGSTYSGLHFLNV